MLRNVPLTPGAAACVLAVALGVKSFGQAGFVASMTDIAPRQGGRVFGICNTFGGLAGMLGVYCAGCMIDAGLGYGAVFNVMTYR